MTSIKNDKWISATQSAAYLNISDRTLRNLCKEGKLKYCQPGRKLLFHQRFLDSWVLGYGKRLTPSERKELEELS